MKVVPESQMRYIAVNADGRTRFVETDDAGLHFLRTVLLAFGFGQVPFDPNQPNVPHRCYMVAHPEGLSMVGRVVDHTEMIHGVNSDENETNETEQSDNPTADPAGSGSTPGL